MSTRPDAGASAAEPPVTGADGDADAGAAWFGVARTVVIEADDRVGALEAAYLELLAPRAIEAESTRTISAQHETALLPVRSTQIELPFASTSS